MEILKNILITGIPALIFLDLHMFKCVCLCESLCAHREDYSLDRPEMENNARELLNITRMELQKIANQLNVVEKMKLLHVTNNMVRWQ